MVRSFQFRNARAFRIKKKILLMVLLAQMLLCSCALSQEYEEMRSSSRPYAFPGSSWESDNPKIRLDVSKNEGDQITGYIITKGEKIDVVFSLTQGNNATLYNKEKFEKAITPGGTLEDGAILMEVYCSYSAEKIQMKVYEDNVFEEGFDTITLYRADGTD